METTTGRSSGTPTSSTSPEDELWYRYLPTPELLQLQRCQRCGTEPGTGTAGPNREPAPPAPGLPPWQRVRGGECGEGCGEGYGEGCRMNAGREGGIAGAAAAGGGRTGSQQRGLIAHRHSRGLPPPPLRSVSPAAASPGHPTAGLPPHARNDCLRPAASRRGEGGAF